MHNILKFGATSLALIVGVAASPGQARAATTIATGDSTGLVFGTTYQYGNTTFTLTGCSAVVYTTDSCSNLQLIAVANGRAGTEIEIAEKPATASDIYSLTGGGSGTAGSQSLSFVLTVGVLAGSNGISSVTNIIDGSDKLTSTGATVTTNDSLVSSQLSAFSGVTPGGSQLSNLTTPSSNTTFAAVTSGQFGFTDRLLNDAGVASNAYALKLTDVKLLFNPAPEPASMALFATALAGLTAVRRRFPRRPNP